MANREHLKILKQGVKVWNRWREDNPRIFADLSHTELNDLDLEGANLGLTDLRVTKISECNLSSAIFSNASMTHTTFNNVQLVGTDLSKLNIVYNTFGHCDLEKAILTTSIRNTHFYGADLKDTDFSFAYMSANSFSNVDLSPAKGLETIKHHSSSTIGIDTLYKSAGKIPVEFLRGCGVPEDFIIFIPSLIGAKEAIQFYSCFISYSSKDEEFAQRLFSRMRDKKLRVWFAPEDMRGGRKFVEQIEQAIQLHDRLLLILSEESMKSNWVIREIKRARKTEREQDRRKLFPIRLVDFETIKNWEALDTDTGEDIAEEVRSYHIPDFSDWKNHDSFEKGFEGLLSDLRAEEKRQAQERG